MMMMMMMMMMMLMMIMITTATTIALKGVIPFSFFLFFFFFYNLLMALRTVSNKYTKVAKAQPRAIHVQHMRSSSRVVYRVPRGTKGQLSYYV